ncbi:MAG: hypothetical protein GY777_02845 [Candidatus Brocadiaceae bacterium]|nr:hypothetical protein [Candidatus Brocadiaceae bacterium]
MKNNTLLIICFLLLSGCFTSQPKYIRLPSELPTSMSVTELEAQLEHCKAELKKPEHYIPPDSVVFILEDRIKELEAEISRRKQR